MKLLTVFALLPIAFACPYLKFSPDHSYCKPRNPQCRMFAAGFNKREKKLIVKFHNKFRNKIALGKERRAGGMPPAANMLQMEWDEELAAIAQKWAEQCGKDHDCAKCREVACLPVNSKCLIYDAGFRSTEKDLIVKLHNEYRSKVAMGKETRGGRLPPAADMLEMEWDEELAFIAQTWADQCKFENDCFECRSVYRFPNVGQSLFKESSAEKFILTRANREKRLEDAIKYFYDEISQYKKRWILKHQEEYGHFTQIIWAKTFRLGCGKVHYREKGVDNFLLVCNYAPAGNRNGYRVYKPGEPCSSCPEFSCCGYDCRDYGHEPQYEGLCKKLDPYKFFFDVAKNSTEVFSKYVWKNTE